MTYIQKIGKSNYTSDGKQGLVVKQFDKKVLFLYTECEETYQRSSINCDETVIFDLTGDQSFLFSTLVVNILYVSVS